MPSHGAVSRSVETDRSALRRPRRSRPIQCGWTAQASCSHSKVEPPKKDSRVSPEARTYCTFPWRLPKGFSRSSKGVDLAIEHGEIHAIMGPSNQSKSTLAYAIAGRELRHY